MSHNSLSAHHCHPPKKKAQEFGLSFQQFFSKTHTHTHTLYLFLYVALNQIKLLSKKYTYYSLNIFYHNIIVFISHLHVVHHCEVAQSIGKLHQKLRPKRQWDYTTAGGCTCSTKLVPNFSAAWQKGDYRKHFKHFLAVWKFHFGFNVRILFVWHIFTTSTTCRKKYGNTHSHRPSSTPQTAPALKE